MFPIYPFPPMIPNLFKLRNDYPEPPTIYSILNSYVNFGKENQTKIADLAKTGRAVFFDFDYPLSSKISKEDFEVMILNKFLMRRIGFETVTAFKIALNVRLNEIMPTYNKLFDALDGWNIFSDGESISRSQQTTNNTSSENTDNNDSTTTDNGTISNTADLRSSDTPQNELSNVRDGSYVSQYNYNQDTGTSSNTSRTISENSNSTEVENSGTLSETITRTPHDKIAIYQQFIEARTGIYTMIFEDLNRLFYNIY